MKGKGEWKCAERRRNGRCLKCKFRQNRTKCMYANCIKFPQSSKNDVARPRKTRSSNRNKSIETAFAFECKVHTRGFLRGNKVGTRKRDAVELWTKWRCENERWKGAEDYSGGLRCWKREAGMKLKQNRMELRREEEKETAKQANSYPHLQSLSNPHTYSKQA